MEKEVIHLGTVRSAISRYKWFDSFNVKDDDRVEAVDRVKAALKAYCINMAKANHGRKIEKERFLQGFRWLFNERKSSKKEDVLFVLALSDFYIMTAKNYRWSHTHKRDEFWEHFADEEANKYSVTG